MTVSMTGLMIFEVYFNGTVNLLAWLSCQCWRNIVLACWSVNFIPTSVSQLYT